MKFIPQLLRALAWAAALSLTACASVLTPRYATESEAITARGAPTARHDNGDGTFTLEYATQPDGTSCLMIQVDGAGRALRQWDALDDDNLDRVKPGMDKQEVARLLGERRSEKIFPRTGDEVWEWKIARDGTSFNVRFVQGKVKHVARVYPRPRHYYGDYDYWHWGPVFYPATVIYLWSLDWRFHGHHWGGHWRHGGRGRR
jgi:hypothetical protein